MKKLMLLLLLSVVMLTLGTGSVHAINIDGMVTSTDEWDNWYLRGIDPNEDIDNNYDIKMLMVWWDDDYAYVRTDVYGIPTLVRQDPENEFPAFYQWMFDLDGNGSADFKAILNEDNADLSGNRVKVTKLSNNSVVGFYQAHIGDGNAGSIVEWKIDTDDLGDIDGFNMQAWMKLDNAGSDDDDRLPDLEGWVPSVPEPGSAMLLGMGLVGFVGVIRRKFKA